MLRPADEFLHGKVPLISLNGLEIKLIKQAINEARKEAIEAAAEKAGMKLNDDKDNPAWIIDKQSILSLINDLK